MRKNIGVCMLATVLLLSGCGPKQTGESRAETGEPEVIAPAEVAKVEGKDADELWQGYQDKLDENMISESFQAGLDQFAYESAARILKEKEGNRNYSPLSLYYALAMAGTGADGKTYEEIAGLLGIEDREEMARQCGNIYRYLHYQKEQNQIYQEAYEAEKEGGKKPEIKIANSLWADQNIDLKPEYNARLTDQFYASIHRVSFLEDQTWKDMGRWISENTNGILEPELTKEDDTVMALINTLYYYGAWKDKFPEEDTKPDIFTRSDGSEVTVDFMNMSVVNYPYREADGYRASKIGTGNQTSMVFVLPDEGHDVSEFLESPEKLKEALDGEYVNARVNWKMPKFSFGSSMKLVEVLEEMGAGTMFTDSADFGHMTDTPVLVSEVIQETHIGVDESGVEGAAYTMLLMEAMGMPIEEMTGDMILDRPFLYGIYSNTAGWLFIGVVENPEGN